MMSYRTCTLGLVRLLHQPRQFRSSPLIALIAWAMVCIHGGCAASRQPLSFSEGRVYLNAAVAADHVVASQAGLAMLQRGGNAVDAAVATSFCLSVVRPYSCGIGGGGFMLIYMPAKDGAEAKTVAINYRETAPAMVGADYFTQLNHQTASRFGHHAVAIPGTVAGLAHALKNYGTLDLPTVLEPAIRAAEEGVPADANFISAARELQKDLEEHPALAKLAEPIWQDICLRGTVRIGDVIKQPQQARALRLIAEHGVAAFYQGEIGRAIVASMQTHGGPITLSDLNNYEIREVEALHGRFCEYTIVSMPPPSSGGIAMQQILGIVDRGLARLDHQTQLERNYAAGGAGYIHLVTEAMKHAFADRSRWLADPAFVDVPIEQLTSSEYLDHLADFLSMERTLSPQDYGSSPPHNDDSGTSHFCVIDSRGMAVACTETINTNYGSLVSVPGFGFALNNEMDDFTTIPNQPNVFGLTQSDRNLPQPEKRPLSSMSPTIVLKDGKVALIAGGSGGPRIISGTTQCILNALIFDMKPQQAVKQPRFHHQWMPNVLQLEEGCSSARMIDDLRHRGHEIGSISVVGQVQMIRIDDQGIRAASDPRKGGKPAGY